MSVSRKSVRRAQKINVRDDRNIRVGSSSSLRVNDTTSRRGGPPADTDSGPRDSSARALSRPSLRRREFSLFRGDSRSVTTIAGDGTSSSLVVPRARRPRTPSRLANASIQPIRSDTIRYDTTRYDTIPVRRVSLSRASAECGEAARARARDRRGWPAQASRGRCSDAWLGLRCGLKSTARERDIAESHKADSALVGYAPRTEPERESDLLRDRSVTETSAIFPTSFLLLFRTQDYVQGHVPKNKTSFANLRSVTRTIARGNFGFGSDIRVLRSRNDRIFVHHSSDLCARVSFLIRKWLRFFDRNNRIASFRSYIRGTIPHLAVSNGF